MNRPDNSWGPEDDDRVRAALMSLMDDVSADPLPEPESIRSRAEGRGTGAVTDLAVRRSRRRSFAFLAGAAAAAVVATTAGLYVTNQSPDRPVATSSAQEDAPTDSRTSTAASRLTMLGTRTWAAVLDRPVESTTTRTPPRQACFEPTDDASWTAGAPVLADGTIPAVQWIGMPRADSSDLTGAVDRALERCSDQETINQTDGTLTDGAAYRGWLQADSDGNRRWWIEVTDGDGLSFLTVPESGTDVRTPRDIQTLAEAIIGEADLTTETSETSETSNQDTATETLPSPTTELIPPPEATGTGTPSDPDTPSSPESPTSESNPVESPTPPQDAIDSARFVPAGSWASEGVTGGAATFAGPLHLEGAPPYIEACITSELDAPVATTGIRSGTGDANYFGRQFIAVSADADAVYSELVSGYAGGSCPGPAIGGSATQLASGIFKLQQGDLTTYLAVVRMQGQGVTVLHLSEATTAPEPLTDSVAVAELTRLSNLAAAR